MSKNSALTSKLAARLAARGISLKSKPPPEPESPKTTQDIINEKLRQRSSAAQPLPTTYESKLVDEFSQKLPEGWEKHFSQPHDTWFYWDLLTDRVSWLPPGHEFHEPQLTRSENDFSTLKRNLTGVTLPGSKNAPSDENNKQKQIQKEASSNHNPPSNGGNPLKRSFPPVPAPEKKSYPSFTNQGYGQKSDKKGPAPVEDDNKRGKFDIRKKRQGHSLKRQRAQGVGEEFDPMDPSAYSDAPRGNWGRGMKSEKSSDIW